MCYEIMWMCGRASLSCTDRKLYVFGSNDCGLKLRTGELKVEILQCEFWTLFSLKALLHYWLVCVLIFIVDILNVRLLQ